MNNNISLVSGGLQCSLVAVDVDFTWYIRLVNSLASMIVDVVFQRYKIYIKHIDADKLTLVGPINGNVLGGPPQILILLVFIFSDKKLST